MTIDASENTGPVGYARVSKRIAGDLSDQIRQLQGFGVHPADIYLDTGLAGRPTRPSGRDEALRAADGRTLQVTRIRS